MAAFATCWLSAVLVATALAAGIRADVALYVGHGFAGTLSFGGILKFNGSAWAAVDLASTVNGNSGVVNALVSPDGMHLYAGGVIIDGSNNVRTSNSFVDLWNGSAWSTLTSEFCYTAASAPCFSSTVQALAVFNGDVYAGGFFATVRPNVTAHSIARWNGATWSALDVGVNGTVRALATFRAALYAAGNLVKAGMVAVANVARWDGHAWSAVGSGVPFAVNALAVYNDGLYAGGVGGILAWDGQAWHAVNGGINGSVNALSVFGGALYAGGQVVAAGSIPVNMTAQWNGATWLRLGTGIAQGAPDTLGVYNQTLYIGGLFSGAGDLTSVRNLAAWTGTVWRAPSPPMPVSLNGGIPVAPQALLAACDLGWTGTNCATCGPGFTATSGTCAPCPFGTFKAVAGAAPCTLCPGGHSNTTATAAVSVAQCVCLPGWTGPTCAAVDCAGLCAFSNCTLLPVCAACAACATSAQCLRSGTNVQIVPAVPGSACVDVYNAQYRWLAQATVVLGEATVPTAALGGATTLIVEGYSDAACSSYIAESAFSCAVAPAPTLPLGPPTCVRDGTEVAVVNLPAGTGCVLAYSLPSYALQTDVAVPLNARVAVVPAVPGQALAIEMYAQHLAPPNDCTGFLASVQCAA